MAVQRLGCKHWILDAPEGQRVGFLRREMLSKFKMRLCCFLNGETSHLKRRSFGYFPVADDRKVT